MNLWRETLETLKDRDKSWDDVEKVGSKDGYISKELFEKLAKKTEYDDGFGGQEVATDLVIEGKGFIMFREEYDGSEWWRFMDLNSNIGKKELKNITTLDTNNADEDRFGWSTLKELND